MHIGHQIVHLSAIENEMVTAPIPCIAVSDGDINAYGTFCTCKIEMKRSMPDFVIAVVKNCTQDNGMNVLVFFYVFFFFFFFLQPT